MGKRRISDNEFTTLRIDREARGLLGEITKKDETFNDSLKRILKRGPFL